MPARFTPGCALPSVALAAAKETPRVTRRVFALGQHLLRVHAAGRSSGAELACMDAKQRFDHVTGAPMSWLKEFIHRWDAAVLELMPRMLRHSAAPFHDSSSLSAPRYFTHSPDWCNAQSWDIPVLDLPIQAARTPLHAQRPPAQPV